MTQYNEHLEQIRCPCAYRVQCGLSCCHEMIILSPLDALKNKYLITSLIRVEYSQQYINVYICIFKPVNYIHCIVTGIQFSDNNSLIISEAPEKEIKVNNEEKTENSYICSQYKSAQSPTNPFLPKISCINHLCEPQKIKIYLRITVLRCL
ncbi:Hypothetical_protein [Hexamita inflata]|uniref:Hypothetical_protein n=1 Tax=Hexamita inflata TaxID=28002 RepID=A0AA86PZZ1_9EUKA|nr:Hypothetical protein HINF_LOCUS34643 [Hexamita inflata]